MLSSFSCAGYQPGRRFIKPTEPDYASFELDTTPLDALEPTGKVEETRVSGVWVKTETKVETSIIV
jgi:hypothetical protein